MTQQIKVTINQWLLTLVAMAFGIWGGYQVLQYKVDSNTEHIEINRKERIYQYEALQAKLDTVLYRITGSKILSNE